jgi:hypothetical protein
MECGLLLYAAGYIKDSILYLVTKFKLHFKISWKDTMRHISSDINTEEIQYTEVKPVRWDSYDDCKGNCILVGGASNFIYVYIYQFFDKHNALNFRFRVYRFTLEDRSGLFLRIPAAYLSKDRAFTSRKIVIFRTNLSWKCQFISRGSKLLPLETRNFS